MRYFGAPIYRMGARVSYNAPASHGYWAHSHGAHKPVMPAYGGFFGGYGDATVDTAIAALREEYAEIESDYEDAVADDDGSEGSENYLNTLERQMEDIAAEIESLGGTISGDVDLDDLDDLDDSDLITTGSGTTTGSGLSSNLPGAISAVSGAKVKDKAGFDSFVSKVKNAYKIETGKDLSYSESTPSGILDIAPLFGKLSDAAKSGSKTVAAIIKAAGWFYCNPEKEALKDAGKTKDYNDAVKYCKSGGTTSSSGGRGGSRPPAGSSVGKAVKGGKPFYKQTWFLVTGGILLAGVLFGVPAAIVVRKRKK